MGASFITLPINAGKEGGRTMKKRFASALLALFVALCLAPAGAWAEVGGGIPITAENFPDDAFRTVVQSFDKNNNGELSAEEIAAVDEISCSGKKISSLKGIEYFIALEELDCSENALTTLDVSNNIALEELDCSGNSLTALDVSKNTALVDLSCDDNQITLLDLSNNEVLEELYCDDNPLGSLDLSHNLKLDWLSCAGNKLTTLDVSKLTALCVLSCGDNQLTSLDIAKNTALEILECSGNQLSVLNVNNNTALWELDCSNNLLTELDLSNNEDLLYLYCTDNQLTSLDLSNNLSVEECDCDNNSYVIGLDADNSFDLSKLPGNFNVNNAYRWANGKVSGTKLTVNDGAKYVTYSYDLNDDYNALFYLYVGYVVNFETDGGTAIPSQTVNRSANVEKPAVPTKTGFVFDDWYTDSTYTEAYNFDTPVTKATTIYAKWVADTDAPVISGVENGKTYCAAPKVTVTDAHLASVTVDGTEVALSVDGTSCSFTLPPAEQAHTIVATDKAGNTTTITATVNDGHTPKKVEGKAANCTEDGLTDGEKCSVCGEVLTEQEVIPATGHKPETVTGKTATCTEAGLTDGEKCSVCGKVLTEQKVIPATGHDWGAWTSSGDGTHSRTCKNDSAHKETVECAGGTATCVAKAVCETCGAEYGELDPAHHANLVHVAAKEATTAAEGNTEYWYCDGCGKYFSDAAASKEIAQSDIVVPKKSEPKKDEDDKGGKKDDGKEDAPKKDDKQDDKKSKRALPQTGDASATQVALLLAGGIVVLGVAMLAKKRNA